MGDIDHLVSFLSGEHLDFSGAQPPDELWDDSFAGTEGDSVGHVAQVWLESSGDVDGSQVFLEVGNFEAVSDELVAELLLPGVAGVEFLAGGQGAAVYGGNESIGDSMDHFVDIRVHAQKDLGGSG